MQFHEYLCLKTFLQKTLAVVENMTKMPPSKARCLLLPFLFSVY